MRALDMRFYQGLSSSIIDSKLPVVLPRYEYSYFGRTDPLGGRLSLDTERLQRHPLRRHQHAARRSDAELGPAVRRSARRPVEVTLHGDRGRL